MGKLRCLSIGQVLLVLGFACSHWAIGQTVETGLPSGVPRLVKFSGVLKDAAGRPLDGTQGVSFAVYADSTGGAALWEETQNVQFVQGRYTAFLGQSRSTGIPAEIFSSGQPRWLGVRILASGEEEQARTFLTSVPYALKAVDADTVGGLPPAAFLRANPAVPSEPAAASLVVPAYAMQNVLPSAALGVATSDKAAGTVPEFASNGALENSPIKIAHGVVSMPNLENVRYADRFPCPSSRGCEGKSDFGAQVNAAYASLAWNSAIGSCSITFIIFSSKVTRKTCILRPVSRSEPERASVFSGEYSPISPAALSVRHAWTSKAAKPSSFRSTMCRSISAALP
jgi:hypothetical protein